MAERSRILGQVPNPAADEGLSTEIYVCPSGQLARIESVFVLNASAVASFFAISVDKGGDNPGVPEAKDYLYRHHAIAAWETFVVDSPILLESDDRIEGASDSTDLVFNVYGTEY